MCLASIIILVHAPGIEPGPPVFEASTSGAFDISLSFYGCLPPSIVLQVSTFGVTSDTDSSQPMTSLLRCASGSACSLPSALTSLSPSVAFRSTLLAGDDAGCLLVIDPRVGGQSSVARRFYAAIGQSLDVCPALERSTVRLGDCRLENISGKAFMGGLVSRFAR